jgi:hypothetical protein
MPVKSFFLIEKPYIGDSWQMNVDGVQLSWFLKSIQFGVTPWNRVVMSGCS